MALNLQVRAHAKLGELTEALRGWLAATGRFGAGAGLEDVGYIEGAGSANETIRAVLSWEDGGGRHQAGVVIRLLLDDIQCYFDTRLDRQIAIINWVRANTSVPVPEILAADPDGVGIGRRFIVMRHISGQAPCDFPGYNKTGFLVDMDEATRRRFWRGAMDMLIRVHRSPHDNIDFLDFPGRNGAGLGDLVAHWRNSLDWAGAAVPKDYFGQVADWLQREMPGDAPAGLSWGDARVANMLFEGPVCTAVLDWEMASCGGPLVDLAWWLLFDRIQDEDTGVARLQGLGSRAETIAYWQAGTGLSAARLHWHEVFAAYMLAITRGKSFADRRQLGLPVPAEDDPRSVRRLQRRIDALLGG